MYYIWRSVLMFCKFFPTLVETMFQTNRKGPKYKKRRPKYNLKTKGGFVRSKKTLLKPAEKTERIVRKDNFLTEGEMSTKDLNM